MTSAKSIQNQAAQYWNDPIMQQIAAEGGNSASSGTGEVTQMGLGDLINTLSNISATNNALAAASVADARNWNQQMTKWTMDFNAAEAAKNRDWQEYMSNTAHQREVADLKAAGLNPVLSAMGGNGAAVTSGSSASASAPRSDVADTDKSVSQSLVTLLGNLLSAEMQMRNADLNARTQEAVADTYTQMSKYVAELQAATQLQTVDISGKYGVQAASAGAWGSISAAQIAQQGAMDRLLAEQQHDIFMHQNYPNNWFQLADAIGAKLFGQGWLNADQTVTDMVKEYTEKFGKSSTGQGFLRYISGHLGVKVPSDIDIPTVNQLVQLARG